MQKYKLLFLVFLMMGCASLKVSAPKGEEMGIAMLRIHKSESWGAYLESTDKSLGSDNRYVFEFVNLYTGETVRKETARYDISDDDAFMFLYNIPYGTYYLKKITYYSASYVYKTVSSTNPQTGEHNETEFKKRNSLEIFINYNVSRNIHFSVSKQNICFLGKIYIEEHRASGNRELKGLRESALVYLSRSGIYKKWGDINVIIGDEIFPVARIKLDKSSWARYYKLNPASS